MALVACPGCGRQISDRANACFECGWSRDEDVPAGQAPTAPAVGQAAGPAEPPAAVSPLKPFFPVATHKFVVMSIASLGAYPVYWSYQNWKRIAQATGEGLSPFWRAFFTPIWFFPLFGRVRARAEEEGIAVGWPPALLAGLYLLSLLVGFLGTFWVFLSLLGFAPLLPVLATSQAVNARHPSPEGPNSRYSLLDVGCIILGVGLLVLGGISAFLLALLIRGVGQ